MDYKKLHKDTIIKLQEMVNSGKITVETARGICADFIPESEDERIKKEIINYLECQSRDEPSRKDTHNKWINYIEKQALSKDDYDFLRDCARVLKTFGWQSYADRLAGLCPTLGEEAKAMMSTPIIFDESEEERIRKGIIERLKCDIDDMVKSDYALNYETEIKELSKYIAWLEKQGEQKPADKVESKFKVGDKIRKKVPRSFDKDMEVARIEKDYYVCNHIGKFSSEVVPFSEESYYELIEHNPAWSEEDEKMHTATIFALAGFMGNEDKIAWLKSLKDRVLPQPKQEWSKEDLMLREEIINLLQKHGMNKEVDWLKSLRPKNRWKPSGPDILLLERIANGKSDPQDFQASLYALIGNLKKLREK